MDLNINKTDPRQAERQTIRPARFQFNLRSLFFVATVFAVLFALFRWANLSVWVSLLVTLIVVVSFMAGFALIVALIQSLGDDQDE